MIPFGALLVAATIFAAGGSPVAATVTVVSSAGVPAADVAVVLDDGTELARTDAHGVAIVRVSAGTRLHAVANGAHSESLAASSAMRLVLRAVIGITRARTAPATVRRDDDRSLLAGDPAAALAYSAQRRAPSQGGTSRFRIDGIPVELPLPPSGDAPPVSADLLESATPVRSPDGGWETDYRLAAPSKRAAARGEFGIASNDGAAWRAVQTGPGYAVAFAHRRDDGALAGRTFLDASGLAYPHDLAASRDAASVVLNRRFGTSTLAFTASGSRSASNIVETAWPGPLPAGYGPGNRATDANGLAFVLWSAVRGRDTLRALDVRFAGAHHADLRAARRAGLPLQDASWSYAYSGRSEGLGITRTFGETSVAIDAGSTRSSNDSTSSGNAGGSRWERDTLRLGVTRGRTAFAVTGERTGGGFSGRAIDVDASWKGRIAGFDARVAAYSGAAQSDVASYARSYPLSAPSGAALTCDPPSATVVAPSATALSPPRATTLTLDLERSSRLTTVQAGGFVSRVRNALVRAAVVDPAALPPGYDAALAAAYAPVCGNALLTANDTILQRWESIPVLDQREWFVDVRRRVGAIELRAFVERFDDVATVVGNLAGRRTDVVRGAQLPHVSSLRTGFIASAPLGAAKLAAGIRELPAGNAYDRAPRPLLDLAARLPLRSGELVLSAQNVFAAGGGSFATSRGAVPLATTIGAPFAALAEPVPSTWSIRYVLARAPR
jgi:hypothetical protein